MNSKQPSSSPASRLPNGFLAAAGSPARRPPLFLTAASAASALFALQPHADAAIIYSGAQNIVLAGGGFYSFKGAGIGTRCDVGIAGNVTGLGGVGVVFGNNHAASQVLTGGSGDPIARLAAGASLGPAAGHFTATNA